MAVSNRLGLLVTAIVVSVSSGCGRPTAAVSGTVTYKGTSVTGLIVFSPQDGAKYREAVEGAIVEGRYNLPAVSPGPKRIDVIVTRNGVSDPSLDVTPSPRTVDLQPGQQVIDITVLALK